MNRGWNLSANTVKTIGRQRLQPQFPGCHSRSDGSIQIDFTVDGIRRTETIRTNSMEEACAIRLKRIAALRADPGGFNAIVEMKFDKAMDYYASVNEKLLTERTLQRSRCIYGHFVNFIRRTFPNITAVNQLTNVQAIRYKDYLLGVPGKKPSGINTDISKLRAIFKKFKESKFIASNIFAEGVVSKISARHAQPEKKHLPTDQQIVTVLEAVKDDPSYRELTEFMVKVGRRVGEVISYEKRDVALDDKGLPIKLTIRGEITKTKVDDQLLLDDELTLILKTAMAKHPASIYVFTNSAGRQISANTYRDFLGRICLHCEIDDNITPHCFRYYVVNKLHGAGVNIRDIMAITGHKDIESLFEYLKSTEEGQRRGLASNRLSQLQGAK